MILIPQLTEQTKRKTYSNYMCQMLSTVWCYEQVCLAEMFKLPKMLLANLLIARVIRWHGKFSRNLNWNTKQNFY